MSQHLKNAMHIELEKLKKQNERIRKLATKQGFFQAYFEKCATEKNNIEAFTAVNDEYFSFFGEFRYNSYNSFRQQKNSYFKK